MHHITRITLVGLLFRWLVACCVGWLAQAGEGPIQSKRPGQSRQTGSVRHCCYTDPATDETGPALLRSTQPHDGLLNCWCSRVGLLAAAGVPGVAEMYRAGSFEGRFWNLTLTQPRPIGVQDGPLSNIPWYRLLAQRIKYAKRIKITIHQPTPLMLMRVGIPLS